MATDSYFHKNTVNDDMEKQQQQQKLQNDMQE